MPLDARSHPPFVLDRQGVFGLIRVLKKLVQELLLQDLENPPLASVPVVPGLAACLLFSLSSQAASQHFAPPQQKLCDVEVRIQLLAAHHTKRVGVEVGCAQLRQQTLKFGVPFVCSRQLRCQVGVL